eukprot:jgi/Botrbrau1/6699/Bobra.0202s0036.1
MSVITLQVGQCGNQVGRALFDALAAEAEAKDNNYSYGVLTSFFKEGSKSSRLCARTVLVDTEPKVLADTLAGSKASRAWWSYGDSHTLLDCSGSGNNWARGFSYCSMQKADPVMDLLRREVEAADRLGGFLVMQSVAGGTGAGLGTGLTQALRDAYPLASILNHCIWPYEAGEIIVQSYNSVLTLSHLVRVSDGLLLVQNDALRDTCRASLNQPRPSTEVLPRKRRGEGRKEQTWASQLLATGAYVHQYQAFGLERDDLTRSIARTEEVIARKRLELWSRVQTLHGVSSTGYKLPVVRTMHSDRPTDSGSPCVPCCVASAVVAKSILGGGGAVQRHLATCANFAHVYRLVQFIARRSSKKPLKTRLAPVQAKEVVLHTVDSMWRLGHLRHAMLVSGGAHDVLRPTVGKLALEWTEGRGNATLRAKLSNRWRRLLQSCSTGQDLASQIASGCFTAGSTEQPPPPQAPGSGGGLSPFLTRQDQPTLNYVAPLASPPPSSPSPAAGAQESKPSTNPSAVLNVLQTAPPL